MDTEEDPFTEYHAMQAKLRASIAADPPAGWRVEPTRPVLLAKGVLPPRRIADDVRHMVEAATRAARQAQIRRADQA